MSKQKYKRKIKQMTAGLHVKAKFKCEKNWMTPKTNQKVFVKTETPLPIKRSTDYLAYDHVLQISTFGHLDEFGQFLVARSGLNHAFHTNAFHLSLYPRCYALPFKSSSPYRHVFRKTVFFPTILTNLTTEH